MPDNNETTLKPCPFCGGEAETYTFTEHAGDGETFQEKGVRCRICDATQSTPELWNTRPNEPTGKGVKQMSNEIEKNAKALEAWGEAIEAKDLMVLARTALEHYETIEQSLEAQDDI